MRSLSARGAQRMLVFHITICDQPGTKHDNLCEEQPGFTPMRSLRNAVAVLLVKGVIAEESSASAKLAVSREYHMKPSHVAILVLR
eukprot:s6110_g3.t1